MKGSGTEIRTRKGGMRDGAETGKTGRGTELRTERGTDYNAKAYAGSLGIMASADSETNVRSHMNQQGGGHKRKSENECRGDGDNRRRTTEGGHQREIEGQPTGAPAEEVHHTLRQGGAQRGGVHEKGPPP